MFPGFITVDNIHINNFSSKPQSFLTSKIYFIIKSYYPLWPLLPNLQLPFHSSNYIFIPEPRLYSLLYLILLRQLCQVVFNSTVMELSSPLDIFATATDLSHLSFSRPLQDIFILLKSLILTNIFICKVATDFQLPLKMSISSFPWSI